ncbi:FadR/GntR family transcriptional regulator [Croceibacterium aestuarii]|uniref:FadR/GntR family transcriptional regulator n=1 Tax=Croceibacterium aestuarii TaxID=3064139 RepID=UPI00272DCB59|nr:GntR family transcriptional regulator [Croceibacterium sp. D39]
MASAEQIYSSSTSEDATPARLAEKLARLIEDEIAINNLPAGGIVGSLRDLSERYSVGRAATREAVALLERRGLGRLRPGPCGGFVVAQPEADSIGTELANYFRLIEVTRRQIQDAYEAVDLTAAGAAARAETNEDLLEWLRTPQEFAGPQWHREIRRAVGRMSGEPVLELFVQCLNALTEPLVGSGAPDAESERSAAIEAGRLASAIEAGDGGAATAAAAHLHARLRTWLENADSRIELPDIETSRMADDRTLASLVARRIAAEVVRGSGSGQRLGSEWDLCERYSVSRTTLRQAIRQLQDSGLVECRRGRGNGLLTRDPRGTGSIRLVLAFLISRQMDPLNAGTFLFQLNRYVPALAVSRASPAQRVRLEKLLARVRRSVSIDRYDLLRLVQCVSQAANSPIIDLFSRCLAAYEARFHPQLMERLPTDVQSEYFDLLSSLMADFDDGSRWDIDRAKEQSAKVMLEMSRTRPI